MARQDQDTLLSRKTQLENELKMAEVIDLSSVDVSMVSIGSVVTARKDGSGESSDFTILGAWDSDPAKNPDAKRYDEVSIDEVIEKVKQIV